MNSTPIKAIDARTAKNWVEQGRAVLVDVREPEEWRQGHIAGAFHVPLSDVTAASMPQTNGKTVVFYCRSGTRTALSGPFLIDAAGPNAVHLDGGILDWINDGLPIEYP